MTTIHDLGWWYWFLTVGLLGAGLLGWPAGIFLAIALCAVQIVMCSGSRKTSLPFPYRCGLPTLRC